MLLCVGRGWRDGSVPIRSRAFSYEISYAGSAMGTAAAATATGGCWNGHVGMLLAMASDGSSV
jgi:hypothetical protein